jgi:hypothetical protein
MSDTVWCSTCGEAHPLRTLSDGTRWFTCPKGAEWYGIVAIELPVEEKR